MITNLTGSRSRRNPILLACLIILLTPAQPGIATQDSPVREAQWLLAELGYSPGPIDGILGPQTLSALNSFQRSNRLEVTDNVNSTTLRRLRAAQHGSGVATKSAIPPRASRASLPERVSQVINKAGLEDGSAMTNVPLALKTRSPRRYPMLGAGQVVGLFALAVVIGTLVLGLLGLFGVVSSLSERAPPLLLRRVCSLVANQAGVCRNALRKSAFWHRLTRSFLGQTVVMYLDSVASSKKFQAVMRPLQFFASGKARSHSRQRRAAPWRHRQDTPSAIVHKDATPLELTLPESNQVALRRDRSADVAAEQGPDSRLAETSDNQFNAVDVLPETPVRKRSPVGDPLAALSIQLAFERFDEAEELAKSAVEQYPERPEYRLRLLQVYHEAGNRIGFEYHAKVLCAAVGSSSPMMAMVAEWWHDLAPNEESFPAADSELSSIVEPGEQEGEDTRSATRDRE